MNKLKILRCGYRSKLYIDDLELQNVSSYQLSGCDGYTELSLKMLIDVSPEKLVVADDRLSDLKSEMKDAQRSTNRIKILISIIAIATLINSILLAIR